jgi:hypothetical protein
MASIADHSTLCPYCDSPLPSSPSLTLQRLLKKTFAKSRPDSRPWNIYGRKAPFAVYISVCQRHNFETEVLPEAEEKGWPKAIDWDALRERVDDMREVLQELIEDRVIPKAEDEGEWCLDPDVDKGEEMRRDACIFWTEILEEVRAKGAKVVAGFQGQFASFEKVQLG